MGAREPNAAYRASAILFDIDRGVGDPRGGCPLHSIPCPIRLFAGSNLNPIEGSFPNVAKDVCRILALSNPSVALRPLGSDEKAKTNLAQRGMGDDFSASDALKSLRPARGRPRLALISESGLYKLVMRSDKPEARGFQDWVTKTVLPAISKDAAERRHAILPHQGRGNPRRVVISERAKTNLTQPGFVAKDVCDVLGLENPSSAVHRQLNRDEYRHVPRSNVAQNYVSFPNG